MTEKSHVCTQMLYIDLIDWKFKHKYDFWEKAWELIWSINSEGFITSKKLRWWKDQRNWKICVLLHQKIEANSFLATSHECFHISSGTLILGVWRWWSPLEICLVFVFFFSFFFFLRIKHTCILNYEIQAFRSILYFKKWSWNFLLLSNLALFTVFLLIFRFSLSLRWLVL
jgi:hypothetical protein